MFGLKGEHMVLQYLNGYDITGACFNCRLGLLVISQLLG